MSVRRTDLMYNTIADNFREQNIYHATIVTREEYPFSVHVHLRPFDPATETDALETFEHTIRFLRRFESKHYPETWQGSAALLELTGLIDVLITQIMTNIRCEGWKEVWFRRRQLPWIEGTESTVAAEWQAACRPHVSFKLSIWPEAVNPVKHSLQSKPHLMSVRMSGTGIVQGAYEVSEGVNDTTVTVDHLLYDALQKHEVFAQGTYNWGNNRWDRDTTSTSGFFYLQQRTHADQDHLESFSLSGLRPLPGVSTAEAKPGNIIVEEMREMFDRSVQDIKAEADRTNWSIDFIYKSAHSDLKVEFKAGADPSPGSKTFLMQLTSPPHSQRGEGAEECRIVTMPSLA